MTRLRKILIANRGEIVARIARSCRDFGASTVAVYSDADRNAPYVDTCDHGFALGGSESADSYLRVDAVIEAAKKTGADAIHPGYGFLSENPELARACEDGGIVFIGPDATVLELLGSKRDAKTLARTVGVPVVPGYEGDDQTTATLVREAKKIGFPILLKASAGGGGKGMRIVRDAKELDEAVSAAKRESEAAFGDPTLIIERYIERPRHIEIQILADADGRTVHLGERECSIQRRHQKIIEEAPSPFVDPGLRQSLGDAAIALAKGAGYQSAGTVEFIVDESKNFYFLEVNARLQVEHGVTELVTGIDIVSEQLRVASGEGLSFDESPEMIGHAVEGRLYAEDPAAGFLPSPGTLARWSTTPLLGVRIDAAAADGTSVPPYYDPMIAKIMAHGRDRHEARARLRTALARLWAPGITTNQSLLTRVLDDDDFIAGNLSTHFLSERPELLTAPPSDDRVRTAAVAAALHDRELHRRQHPRSRPIIPLGYSNNPLAPTRRSYRHREETIDVAYERKANGTQAERLIATIGDTRIVIVDSKLADDRLIFETDDGNRWSCRVARLGEDVYVSVSGETIILSEIPRFQSVSRDAPRDELVAPMPARVVEIRHDVGEHVEKGTVVAIVEAMKMEHRITSSISGRIAEIAVTVGDQVAAGQRLLRLVEE